MMTITALHTPSHGPRARPMRATHAIPTHAIPRDGIPHSAVRYPPGGTALRCATQHRHFGWHFLSNAILSNAASFVLCLFRCVKDHHNLLCVSPLLKKTRVRRVVLEK